jgi:hypothetical protein
MALNEGELLDCVGFDIAEVSDKETNVACPELGVAMPDDVSEVARLVLVCEAVVNVVGLPCFTNDPVFVEVED